jgi:hypothetical protein
LTRGSPLPDFFLDSGLDHAPGDDEGFLGDGQGDAGAGAFAGQLIAPRKAFSGQSPGMLVALELEPALFRELASQGVQQLGGRALDCVRESSGHGFDLLEYDSILQFCNLRPNRAEFYSLGSNRFGFWFWTWFGSISQFSISNKYGWQKNTRF